MIVEPKPGLEVGRIVIDMRVENASDLTQVALGWLPDSQIRRLDLQALVDTHMKWIGLPTSDIVLLGLRPVRRQRAITATGSALQQIFSAVRVMIEDRDCLIEVAEVPEGNPPLLGRIPLQLMDFWLDTAGKRLAGNPEHGGEWMDDAF